jgi:hypothetical protein
MRSPCSASPGFAVTLESLTLQLLQINMQISKLKHVHYQACKVFIIFNTEHTQRSVLEHMCCGKIPAALDRTDVIDSKYLFHGNLLAIGEAPEVNMHHIWACVQTLGIFSLSII